MPTFVLSFQELMCHHILYIPRVLHKLILEFWFIRFLMFDRRAQL